MADFTSVFTQLKSIMQPYVEKLGCTADSDSELSLDTRHIQKNKKPLWFGGVQIKKNYVSYHLMPVYVNPQLLEGISPDLRKRMQGKSCFNFTTVDDSLLQELAALTEAGFRDYEQQGYVA
jgi:hypothetical protein